mmetsp:Transcript_29283/g.59886  ORF Transcript_29283/g.59886 Transcript_29283/m.59886 type:complete len:211 (-) Transcript_29283:543-1175(-)
MENRPWSHLTPTTSTSLPPFFFSVSICSESATATPPSGSHSERSANAPSRSLDMRYESSFALRMPHSEMAPTSHRSCLALSPVAWCCAIMPPCLLEVEVTLPLPPSPPYPSVRTFPTLDAFRGMYMGSRIVPTASVGSAQPPRLKWTGALALLFSMVSTSAPRVGSVDSSSAPTPNPFEWLGYGGVAAPLFALGASSISKKASVEELTPF